MGIFKLCSIGILCALLASNTAWAQSNTASSDDLRAWEDIAYWETIKNDQDAASFEDYLQLYPNGRFATQAKIRIEALQQTHKAQQWSGLWDYTIDLKNGPVKGLLKLKADAKDNTIRGDLTRARKNSKLSAVITGQLVQQQTVMQGTWKNSKGQTGQLEFRLSDDGNRFSGCYTVGQRKPNCNQPVNRWRAQKRP